MVTHYSFYRDVVTLYAPKHLKIDLDNWMNKISQELQHMQSLSPVDIKVAFLSKLSGHPLYGSTIFNVVVCANTECY